MNKSEQMSARLTAWFKGDLEDEDLTDDEFQELERRVFGAVLQKALDKNVTFTFVQHDTLQ